MKYFQVYADVAIETPLEETATQTASPGQTPAPASEGSGTPWLLIAGVVALVCVAALLVFRARKK